jgi:hypothetical protein
LQEWLPKSVLDRPKQLVGVTLVCRLMRLGLYQIVILVILRGFIDRGKDTAREKPRLGRMATRFVLLTIIGYQKQKRIALLVLPTAADDLQSSDFALPPARKCRWLSAACLTAAGRSTFWRVRIEKSASSYCS